MSKPRAADELYRASRTRARDPEAVASGIPRRIGRRIKNFVVWRLEVHAHRRKVVGHFLFHALRGLWR